MLNKVILSAVVVAAVFSGGAHSGVIELGLTVDNFDDHAHRDYEPHKQRLARVGNNDDHPVKYESKNSIMDNEMGDILGSGRKRTVALADPTKAGQVLSNMMRLEREDKDGSGTGIFAGVMSFDSVSGVKDSTLTVEWGMGGPKNLIGPGFDALAFQIFEIDQEGLVEFKVTVNGISKKKEVRGKDGKSVIFAFGDFVGVKFAEVASIELMLTSQVKALDLTLDAVGACKFNPETGDCGTVPEPSSIALLGLGGTLLILRGRRRKSVTTQAYPS